MLKTLEALETIKSGSGQKGPWHLVSATFDGRQYTGFVYSEIPQVGQSVDVEFYQEEYNGRMQDKFKLASKPKTAPTNNPVNNERSLRIEQYVIANNMLLNKLVKHFELDKPMVGNTGVPYPTGPQGQPNFGEDVNPNDVPW